MMRRRVQPSARAFALILGIASLSVMNFVIARDSDKSVDPVGAPITNKAGCANPVGSWVNQMGSKLKITSIDSTTGAIVGEYQTASGAGGWFPLSGWINSAPSSPELPNNAKIVSFSVRWKGVGSITSWTGFCRGTDELRSVWQLGRANSEFEWDHVLTGADNFKPE